MKGNAAIKQLLKENGFKVAGACNCGGAYTQKFEYETTQGTIKIRVLRTKILFAKPGKLFIKYPIAELKKVVDEIKRDFEAYIPPQKTKE